jgi:hypothetical protein
MLTTKEVEAYHREGWIIPKNFSLLPEQLASLRDALDYVIEENPDTRPEMLVSAHLEGGQSGEGIKGSQAFMKLASDKRILDLVEQIIGKDVVLWGCQIFCKPAGDGMEVPMHQDGQYWPINPLATCSVWVALDDVDVSNGCMRVVPGTHKGMLPHVVDARERIVLNQTVSPGQLNETQVPKSPLVHFCFTLQCVSKTKSNNTKQKQIQNKIV